MLSFLFKGLCRSLFCFIIGFFALLAFATYTSHEGIYVMMFLPMASLLVGMGWAHQRAMKARPPAMPATTVHTVQANVQQVFLSDELIINDLFQYTLVANWADPQTGITYRVEKDDFAVDPQPHIRGGKVPVQVHRVNGQVLGLALDLSFMPRQHQGA
ncbi:hypothetical protein [Pseudomonas sp. NPDC007930]|uniref:hypothetical protein n=1 Tax=Pseudomonas sp. NPDC007930 TaxID=3364417 RepID=UPI0036E95EFF